MVFIADLHIHSKYSRATSRNMDVPNLCRWAKLKGVDLLGTGDFTHHLWLQELKHYLKPVSGRGVYECEGVHFILSVEISNIFSQNKKVYRVHNVVLAPSFEVVEEINSALGKFGNLASDGRPILGISCYILARELFKISQDIMLIPAHIWTPWFSVFGSNSGFDSLEDAFGEYTEKITALETGLSSDPAMNWRLSKLDKYSLVSNSDSHSPSRIGREANVFNCDIDYWQIKEALEKKDRDKFLSTIEFFPEEGKYHYDGHRNCGIRLHPKERKQYKGICPKCGKPLTIGVLSRVEDLADRQEGFVPDSAIPYKSLVPLDEIIAEAKGVQKTAKQVEKEYLNILSVFGTELKVLSEIDEDILRKSLPAKIAQGIINVRRRQIELLPGFDGEYGKIRIFPEGPQQQDKRFGQQQITLF